MPQWERGATSLSPLTRSNAINPLDRRGSGPRAWAGQHLWDVWLAWPCAAQAHPLLATVSSTSGWRCRTPRPNGTSYWFSAILMPLLRNGVRVAPRAQHLVYAAVGKPPHPVQDQQSSAMPTVILLSGVQMDPCAQGRASAAVGRPPCPVRDRPPRPLQLSFHRRSPASPPYSCGARPRAQTPK